MPNTYIITETQEGQRLDVALATFLPDLSLRGVRRLWEQFLVEINGRHARKGMNVKLDDVITLTPLPPLSDDPTITTPTLDRQAGEAIEADFGSSNNFPAPDLNAVEILKRKDGILAIFKPSGLHSAKLPGGRGGLNLEEHLPELCAKNQIDYTKIRLFNRLDCLTTGMVLACETDEAMQLCEQAELAGQMEKRYLALVEGKLHSELVIKNALDTDSRTKSKVLKTDSADPLRHTLITPLYSTADGNEFGAEFKAFHSGCTLVQATIYRGARHQIRAHLSHAGFPILGDPLYNRNCSGSKKLYLHNLAITLPGFTCLAKPKWTEEINRILNGLYPGLFQ